MTDLTPTPNQLQSWIDKICYPHEQRVGPSLKDKELAYLAFKAGADQELEACLQWFSEFYCMETWMRRDLATFRAARRPKPPTDKELALEALEHIDNYAIQQMGVYTIHDELKEDVDAIRRVLEALPND